MARCRFRTEVDIELLAKRLAVKYGECDVLQAAYWLCSKSFGERFFWQSVRGHKPWGWFVSDVNPHDVLLEDEILDVIDNGHVGGGKQYPADGSD